MKVLNTISTLAVAALGFSANALGDGSPLDWMLGCWDAEDGSSREVWVRQSEDQFIGFTVAVAEGRFVFHELLNIDFADGKAHYTAHPEGQVKTTFSAPLPEGKAVSFLKPDHDYPQRIDYRLEGNMLKATISLLDGRKPNHFDKVKCD